MMARWAVDHLRYRLRGSSDEAAAQVMAEVQELLRGTSARELERLGPLVLAGVLPRIYPEMLDEVHAHQDAGRATFIVSAAGVELVEMLARVLGDGGRDRHPLRDRRRGRFTGELDGPFMYGEGKVEAMRRYAEDHDLDLAESFAYSDSASDLPMLRAVGNAVVVNPDEAAARGRPGGGLARDALREARAPPDGRRRRGRRRWRSAASAACWPRAGSPRIGWRRRGRAARIRR